MVGRNRQSAISLVTRTLLVALHVSRRGKPAKHSVGLGLTSWLVVRDGAPGRAFEIVILSTFERPEKPEQTDKPEAKGQRYENHEYFHHDLPGATRRARSAFSITSSEEPDIAAAAIRGVTTPLMAIGTASRLYPTASQRFCRIR